MIKMKKPDPFLESVLGQFKFNKKHPDKNSFVWSRSAEIDIPEDYAQDWIDPVTFKKRLVFGKVKVTEHKFASKESGDIGFQRLLEPALSGGQVKDYIA